MYLYSINFVSEVIAPSCKTNPRYIDNLATVADSVSLLRRFSHGHMIDVKNSHRFKNKLLALFQPISRKILLICNNTWLFVCIL